VAKCSQEGLNGADIIRGVYACSLHGIGLSPPLTLVRKTYMYKYIYVYICIYTHTQSNR